MDITQKSIEELENDYWPALSEYPTGLVERCHNYRKIKIKDLQIHQIITLLIQDIGSDYLMPLVIKRMDEDISEEDDFNGSSFIDSIEFFNDKVFVRNPDLHKAAMELLERKRAEIEELVGEKVYDRTVEKVKQKISGSNKN